MGKAPLTSKGINLPKFDKKQSFLKIFVIILIYAVRPTLIKVVKHVLILDRFFFNLDLQNEVSHHNIFFPTK